MRNSLLIMLFAMLSLTNTYAQNGKGVTVESTDDTAELPYENVHALIVGVSEYTEIRKLSYADDDADLIYDALCASFPSHKDNFVRLKDTEASANNIAIEINDLLGKAKAKDLVIIYFSGHGDVFVDGNAKEHGFFLAYDASSSRNLFGGGGVVPFSAINSTMTSIATINKAHVLLIADACRSGQVTSESNTPLFSSLSNDSGSETRIVSCKPKERSYEFSQLQQGAFTHYLIKAISGEADNVEEDGKISHMELNNYLYSKVNKYVKNEFPGTEVTQKPSVIGQDQDFAFFKVVPGVLDLLEDDSQTGANDTAENKGKNEKKGKGLDDEVQRSATFNQFIEQLNAGNLTGGAKSAEGILAIAKSKGTCSTEEISLMKRELINALLHRSQVNTNKFLSGFPTVPGTNDYRSTHQDLEFVLKMIESSHPLYSGIEIRSKFFELMDQAQSNDPKQVDAAILKLSELAVKHPNVAYINQGLAMIYVDRSDKTKAEEQLDIASQKIKTWDKPKNTNAYINIISGKLEEAERIIEETNKSVGEKGTGNILILKAQLHTANYELHTAANDLQKITENNSNLPVSYVSELNGKIQELRGRVKVAEKSYEKAIQEGGANIDLFIKLGDLYANDLDTAKALSYYNQARNINPKHQGVKAKIALMKGKETIELKEELIDLSDINQVTAIVEAYEKGKENQKAVDLLEKAMINIDWNPELYWLLAKNQFEVKDVKGSKESLRKAIEISPYHFKSIRSLAYIHLHEKHNTVAVNLIHEHDKYFQNSAKWLAFSYQILKKAGNARDLYPILERAIKLDSLETDAYRALYELHLEQFNFEQAEKEYRNLQSIGGGTADSLQFYNKLEREVQNALGRYYYDGVDVGIRLLLKADPYNPQANYYMALTLYMKEDYEGAKKHLKMVNQMVDYLYSEVQAAFYDLKGKVYLETKDYRIAQGSFSRANGNGNPDMLGFSMALYMQKNPNWLKYFKMGGDTRTLNADAMKRYEKMKKVAAKSGAYGGAERNR